MDFRFVVNNDYLWEIRVIMVIKVRMLRVVFDFWVYFIVVCWIGFIGFGKIVGEVYNRLGYEKKKKYCEVCYFSLRCVM